MRHSHLRIIILTILLIHLPFLSIIRITTPVKAANLAEGVVKIESKSGGSEKVGTGFIVCIDRGSAYIVTAEHVVKNTESVQVSIYPRDDIKYPGQVVQRSGRETNDIALIRLNGSFVSTLKKLDFDIGDSNPGDKISLIGFPISGASWSFTEGTVSGLKASNILFSAPIQQGNSGSPLLRNGKVVGLVTEDSGKFGQAIPSSSVRSALRGWSLGNCLASYSYRLTGWIDSQVGGSIKRTPVKLESSNHMPKFSFPGALYELHVVVEQFTNGKFCAKGEVRASPYMSFRLGETSSSQGEARPTFQGGCQVEGDKLAFYLNPSTECN